MPADVALLTCTGDRHEAFSLCQRWVNRQTFTGNVVWVIIDDGKRPLDKSDALESFAGEYVYIHEKPSSGVTLLRNLVTGIEAVQQLEAPKCLFIEDDDWYAPNYVEQMVEWLENARIAGEGKAKYYHLPSRLFRIQSNTNHCSLAQTGITWPCYEIMLHSCRARKTHFVDYRIWNKQACYPRCLQLNRDLHVGMKGLHGGKGCTFKGRGGIGIGHRLQERHNKMGRSYKQDTEGKTLAAWMGEEDAELYLSLGRKGEAVAG